MIPQTWEDSQEVDPESGCCGDDDPLDIVDLTDSTHRIYDMPRMKIIGALPLIDQGELDWKILALEESYA